MKVQKTKKVLIRFECPVCESEIYAEPSECDAIELDTRCYADKAIEQSFKSATLACPVCKKVVLNTMQIARTE